MVLESVGGFVLAKAPENCAGDLCLITNSLKAYWKLEESGGTRRDFANTHDLTDNNTVAQTTGKIGQAADFTFANSEYLQIDGDDTELNFGDQDFTLTGWFYLTSKPASLAGLISKWDNASNDREYILDWDNGADRFAFFVSSTGSDAIGTTANTFGAPSTGVFIFIVAWHDSVANTINIQINDGTVDSTAHSIGINVGNSPIRLGAFSNSTPNRFFDGRIDEAAIWDRVLTSAERTTLYNSGTGVDLNGLFLRPRIGGFTRGFELGFCAGDLCLITSSLEAYWKLEESAGTRFDFADNVNLSDNNTVDSSVAVIGSGAHLARVNSEHLDAASSSFLDFGDEDFTLACWVSLDSKPAGAQTILSKFRAGTNRQYFLDFEPAGDRFRFLVDSDGTSGTTIISANNFGAPTVNTLIFVVAWHDSVANTINIQINNGTTDSAAHSAGVFQGSALFSIGSYQNSGGSAIEFINGIVDEASVWSRLLSSSEKTALYNSGAGENIDDFFIRPEIGGYVESIGIVGPSGSIGGFASVVSQEEIASIGGYTPLTEHFPSAISVTLPIQSFMLVVDVKNCTGHSLACLRSIFASTSLSPARG